MNIIFLDIDGVLISRRSHLSDWPSGMLWLKHDPCAAEFIHSVSIHWPAAIVITGSRRKLFTDESAREGFSFGKIGRRLHQDWRVESESPECPRRGDLIEKWLKNHPEVTDYLIIDDETSELTGEQFSYHLVHTDLMEGFQAEHYVQVLQYCGLSDAGKDAVVPDQTKVKSFLLRDRERPKFSRK